MTKQGGSSMTVGAERFSVSIAPDGAVVPVGELDEITVDEVRVLVDEVMAPGRAIVLDLTQLTFMDSNVIHWLTEVFNATGTPVILRNTPQTAQLLLRVAATVGPDGEAWVFERDLHSPPAD